MRVLDLFSGIGGFSLGLERAGMRTVAFCEIDPYCRTVLRRHWPDVPVFDDVRNLTAETLADAAWNVRTEQAQGRTERERIGKRSQSIDVICGGFPCQDISTAGKGAGITGARSGLWSEYARLIGELRPRYAIVENVAALLNRGLDKVLGDLAALGYDAEWHCIPASAVGAPHRRDRIWIVAYPADGGIRRWRDGSEAEPIHIRSPVPDTDSGDEHRRRSAVQMGWGGIAQEIATDGEFGRTQWSTEPRVGRVAHGVPNRVDRLRALGNAVVPQIPEIIGRAIMKLET